MKNLKTIVLGILWPIERKELKKFLPMSIMMLFVLFNYHVLRSLKDCFVVPNIGAEAISFIKVYAVVPAAVILMLVYAKMTTCMKNKHIFYIFALIFLSFFLIFAFVLYPNQELIHPDPNQIKALESTKIKILLWQLDFSRLKWFFKIYSRWIFVLFYIFAELWGSVMIFLLFWQFANYITKTEEAKRFYPMFGFIGNIGVISGGILVQYFSQTKLFVTYISLCTSAAVVIIVALYIYINKKVLTDARYKIDHTRKIEWEKPKLSLRDGFKLIFSSKYLGFIAILVISYGITVNLIEGPWKSKIRELYPSQSQYAHFMGTLQVFTGIVSMIAMLIGANILKKISWLSGAMVTPLILSISGMGFFIFVVFDQPVNLYIMQLVAFDPLWLAVTFGMIQNVFTKATKYSFFDPTKEMAYIPISSELQTKGKAAVDVVGARFAKSFGAIIQSSLFIIFPTLQYSDITHYLMVIFLVISVIWLIDVKMLYKRYDKIVNSN